MYRLMKENGNNSNILIENEDTHAQINLGRLSMDILSILETEEDMSFGEDGLVTLTGKWDLMLKPSTVEILSKKAMRMSKPPKMKKQTEEQKRKELNKSVDAIDVLLGLANYK